MLDEDYGDITDPLEGRDIKVVCSKNPGQQWAMTEVMPRGRQSKLSNEKEKAKEWLNDIPDVNSIFQLKSYDELSKIINDWLTDSDDEDDDNSITERSGNPTTQLSESNKAYNSLDDAFADLME